MTANSIVTTATNLSKVVETALPALSGSAVTYNADKNIYLSTGYTSAAGNTYFQGIRLSDRIIINYDFGQGYAYLFLNGIRIYGYNGTAKRLIASRTYYSQCFGENFAKCECEKMIMEYMAGQMRLMNVTVDQQQLENFSAILVQETLNHSKLLR